MECKLLNPRLKALVNRIDDRALRKRVLELLENPTFQINGKTYSGLPLEIAPAGLSHHHCYAGGFIEHTVSTAKIAMTMCDCVENIYSGKVNRDLVMAGVIVHDVFKTLTYSVNEHGSYFSTSLADRLDHLSLAVSELVRREFPLDLIHVVSAHHGEYGPMRPRTIEALICHLADLADSRLNGEVLDAAYYLMRRAHTPELYGLDSKEAFEIVNSKTSEGWAGVNEAVEKILLQRKRAKPN